MKWLFVMIAGAVLLAAGTEPINREPVLVELFTSEGCSSCPPADALLEKLDSEEVIVLSEHVDYWNHIGWRDPYSSAKFSQRQETYSKQFRLGSIYTPQIVIDGSAEAVGNNGQLVISKINGAARVEKVPVRIIPVGTDRIRIETDAAAATGDVVIAIASNEASSTVTSGENGGRKLHHVAVVRSLITLGETHKGEAFSKEISHKQDSSMRIIAFVQSHGQGRVLGSAVLKAAR